MYNLGVWVSLLIGTALGLVVFVQLIKLMSPRIDVTAENNRRSEEYARAIQLWRHNGRPGGGPPCPPTHIVRD